LLHLLSKNKVIELRGIRCLIVGHIGCFKNRVPCFIRISNQAL